MKFPNYKIMALILAFFAISSGSVFAQNVDTDPNEASLDLEVQLLVEGCNNNSICESIIGENTANCPLDCPASVDTGIATPAPQTKRAGSRSGSRNEITGQSSGSELLIQNLIALSTFSDINFSFTTNRNSLASVKIGETPDYELSISVENSLRENHVFVFNNLESNTNYFYQIVVVENNGNQKIISGEIITKSFDDVIFAPDLSSISSFAQNPTHLKTVSGNNLVTVTWQNPQNNNFNYVRILKTENSPSDSPLSGELVYEGRGNLLSDLDVNLDKEYFYTLFARYENGNFSNGVSINAKLKNSRSLIEEKNQHENIYGDKEFSVYNFSFIQDRKELEWENESLIASSDEPIIVRLQKRDFFGPVEDIFLEVTFYDRNGTPSYKNIYKFVYKPSLASYEIIISEILPGQFITFNAYVDNKNREKEEIRGSFKVENYSSTEPQKSQSDQPYNYSETGYSISLFQKINYAISVSYPWPQILLFALLTLVAWAISRLLSFVK